MGVVDTELCIRSLAMKSTVSALIICCLGLATAAKVCDPSYSAVGDKCYSVPGLPIQISFWWASEYCSSLTGDLFHVESIDEWRQLNTFLVDKLGYTDTCWTGISAQGHPGTWVVRSTAKNWTRRPWNSKPDRPAIPTRNCVWPSSTNRIWVATNSSIIRAATNTSSSARPDIANKICIQ